MQEVMSADNLRGIMRNSLKAVGTQDIMFRVGKKTYRHEFLIDPLDVDYSGILSLNVLRRVEAKVGIRTSILVLWMNRHRLPGQEVKRCTLVRCHPRIVREASETGLITPETKGPKAPVGTPIPELSSGGSDIGGWDVVASGSVVLPPLSQGIIVGKMRDRSSMDAPQEVLVEPVSIGMPGAYVARVVSRVYTQQELDGSEDLEERSDRETSTSGDKCDSGVNAA
jgi:hypothetical protein